MNELNLEMMRDKRRMAGAKKSCMGSRCVYPRKNRTKKKRRRPHKGNLLRPRRPMKDIAGPEKNSVISLKGARSGNGGK